MPIKHSKKIKQWQKFLISIIKYFLINFLHYFILFSFLNYNFYIGGTCYAYFVSSIIMVHLANIYLTFLWNLFSLWVNTYLYHNLTLSSEKCLFWYSSEKHANFRHKEMTLHSICTCDPMNEWSFIRMASVFALCLFNVFIDN